MTLFYSVARRRVVEMLSYPLEFVFTILGYYAVFLILFFGAQAFGGSTVRSGDTLSSIAVGYVVFVLASQSYQTISNQIMRESTTGLLEQLALCRFGLLPVLLTDFMIQMLNYLLSMSVVMIGIMATTGRWLHFDAPGVGTILVLIMMGVLGLGMMLGALALVFKRVTAVAGLFALAFLFFVAAPVDRYPALKLLPLGHGNALLREVLVNGQSVFDIPGELGILSGVSLLYFAVGTAVFLGMDQLARDRGLLGQY